MCFVQSCTGHLVQTSETLQLPVAFCCLNTGHNVTDCCCRAQVDDGVAVQTRWGPSVSGTYDDCPARAILLSCAATNGGFNCGYPFDASHAFNLRQGSNLVSGLHGEYVGRLDSNFFICALQLLHSAHEPADVRQWCTRRRRVWVGMFSIKLQQHRQSPSRCDAINLCAAPSLPIVQGWPRASASRS